MRTFLALPLDAQARKAAARIGQRWRQAWPHGGVAWVPEENYHVTLRFLGELDDEAARGVAADLSRGAEAISPFSLALEATGAFPNLRRPSVLILAGTEPTDLRDLVADLDRRLAARGLGERDKPFRTHVTVGRVKRPVTHEPPELEREIRWTADRAVLYRSFTGPEGSRYVPLAEALFSGGAGS